MAPSIGPGDYVSLFILFPLCRLDGAESVGGDVRGGVPFWKGELASWVRYALAERLGKTAVNFSSRHGCE